MPVILEIKMSLVNIKKIFGSFNICIIYLHVIETCLNVTIVMFYFYHSKNPSNIMKNVSNSISTYSWKNAFLVKKYPSEHSSWWRCLEDVLKTSFVFVFRRRLDQDQYIRLGHRSSRRLQDVFKASSRFLQDVLPRRLQDVFKTSCKNVFKTSSRSLAKMSSRRLAKTSWDIFKTSSRGSKDGSSG